MRYAARFVSGEEVWKKGDRGDGSNALTLHRSLKLGPREFAHMNWLKYAAIAIAPIILGWGVWTFISSNRPPLPSELIYVDVMSGETVPLELNSIKVIPAKNSKGERVLLPAERRDGKVFVQERYKASLDIMAKDQRFKVDMSTLEVKGAR